jgi:hypothetical protein
MATIGSTKKKKLDAAKMRRILRGAKRLGNPLPGHGKNTVTADVDKLKEQVNTVLPYWKGSSNV